MGTGPELHGILFPSVSGRAHRRRPAIEAFHPERGPSAGLGGKASREPYKAPASGGTFFPRTLG
jgi:hypothetical protein